MAAAASRTIIQRYNEISTALGEHPESYAPIYMRADDGEVLLQEWANGRMGQRLLRRNAPRSPCRRGGSHSRRNQFQ